MSLKLLSQSILFNVKHLFLESEELFELLGVKESDRILQIGCSSAYYTKTLAQIAKDGTVYVIDDCGEALARVIAESGNGHNIVTICCSPDAMLLPRLTFDKVFCLNGLPPLSNVGRAVFCGASFLSPEANSSSALPVILTRALCKRFPGILCIMWER